MPFVAISFPNSLAVRGLEPRKETLLFALESTLRQVLSGGRSNLVGPMETLVKSDDRRVFETQGLIDSEVRDFWLDQDCQWHSDVPDPG